METQKINYLIPISIVLAGALIGAGIYLGSQNTFSPTPAAVGLNTDNSDTPQEIKISPLTKEDHILGSAEAQIVVVEYSDLECPYCKTFHDTLHKVIEDYGPEGKVAWVFRHFPLTELHPTAAKEAEASECAAEQGNSETFFKYVDTLYAVSPTSRQGINPAELPKIAAQIGLDANKFNECLNSGKYADKVAKQRTEAIEAGGQGTPYTILMTKNGNLPITRGAISYEELTSIIDQLLKDLNK